MTNNEPFLARRTVELEEENARLRARVTWLTLALSEAAAGRWRDETVSREQFDLLTHEGRQQ